MTRRDPPGPRAPRGRAGLPRASALAALGALLLGSPLAAQFEEVPPPAAYALEDVTVVRADGTRLTGVNLIVRDGTIEALGADAAVPDDALLLEGDSLHVYPGLIDADGKLDYAFPEVEVDRQVLQAWNPPRAVQGFTPERRVVDHLTATGADAEGARQAGVVALAVHPDDPVMAGRGAFLLLRKDAERPAELVLDPAPGTAMSFRRGPGVYPSTLFGLMAFFRQSFADAARHGRLVAAHRADPRGPAPPWDPAAEVLRRAGTGEIPVYFRADGAEDIRRVLALSRELGFRPVVVGGEEAWKVADLLRSADVPVLVSLDFPEGRRWKPEEAAPEEPPAPEEAPGAEEPPGGEETEPDEALEGEGQETLDPAAAREKARIEAAWANPGRLAAAGVRFALTSGRGEAELREGARTAIEHGLDEAEALRALTATPADLYGVPHLARLQPGYAATFLVADGPLFDEETGVRYTFVEGLLERGRPGASGGEPPAVDVTGSWGLEVTVPGGTTSGTMELQQSGATFRGTLTLDIGSGRIRGGVVSGSEVSFTVIIQVGGEETTARFSGTVEGDGASGTGETEGTTLEWSASRTPEEVVR